MNRFSPLISGRLGNLPNIARRLLLPSLLLCLGTAVSNADDILPRLIFTGDAGENKEVSLDDYNRIEFGDNSMFLKSTKDPSSVLELPYSDFSRFSVSEDLLSGVGQTVAQTSSLSYDASACLLRLDSASGAESEVSLYNVSGVRVLKAMMRGGDTLDLGSLAGGIYVAVAAGEDGNLRIKFVK